MDLILGVDVGTTHIKVGTFSLDGTLQSLHIRATPTISPGFGQAVYDPEEIWRLVVDLSQETVASMENGFKIRSIAVASMAEAGLLVDAQGRPLTPIMSWFDVRGKKEAETWFEKTSPEQFFRNTGLNPNHIYSLFKILWLRDHEPQLYGQARTWLCMSDYFNYRLTGVMATDYSIASRTGLFDLRERTWSEGLLREAGLRRDFLPPTLPSGTYLGGITAEVSKKTGLEEGTPVSLGGHDHVCGAFAAKVIEPGVILDSMGTSESFISVIPSSSKPSLAEYKGFNVGHHVIPGVYYLQGGASSNGVSVEWFLDTFYRSRGILQPYEELVTQALKSPVGANGLFFIPHLRGSGPPLRHPLSKGSFMGIRDSHTQADFARSVLEGVAFEGFRVMQGMESVQGQTFHAVHAVGGGTRNSLWMEIKSNLVQRIVEVPLVQEATLLGAALLGAVGAKIYSSPQQAVETTYKVGPIYEAIPSCAGDYERLYHVYLEILPQVRQLSEIISRGKDYLG